MLHDQAEGLRRLMSASAQVRHIAVLEPGQDSGVVAISLAQALAGLGRSAVIVRAGRLRFYRHAVGARSAYNLAQPPAGDVLGAARQACADPFDILLGSAQAESWQQAPDFVRAASEALIVLHAGEDPAQALAWAYGSIKALAAAQPAPRLRLAVRGAASAPQALAIHTRVAHVASRYLGTGLAFAGCLPLQMSMDAAACRQLAEAIIQG